LITQPPPVKQNASLCDELPIAAPAENVVVPTPPGAAVGHCARRVSSVEATDTVGKAANVLRITAVPVVPVVRDGHIVGLMSQSQLSLNNGTSLDTPVEDVMLPPPPPLTSSMAAGLGLAAMEELGLEVAPVVSASGQLVGVVTRADLVALSSRSIRPPRCGGMATPLGVYLTTGMVRAGAGDLGLFLAGALMGVYAILSLAVIFAAVWLIDERWSVGLISAFGTVPATGRAVVYAPLALIAWMGLYALLFRSSPLAGYHAAEHMTVNAMEAGDDMTAEQVARHSRVHPRCGTNLVVVIATFAIVGELWDISGFWLGFLALVLALGRYTLGGLTQRYLTTRPPSPSELASGVRAGRELIERHQDAVGRPSNVLSRIWCMGLLQAMAGLFAASWAITSIASLLGFGQLVALIA
jgi:CBS domain-containing protein